MYLKQAIIKNSGPLESIDLQLPFAPDGKPKPLVLVGCNGGGKTNLLSLVTDALFEAAAVHYNDVLPTKGTVRAWFRYVGGRTIRVGSPGGFSLLHFAHAGQDYFYKEKAGVFDPNEAKKLVPKDFAAQLNWKSEGTIKEFSVPEDASRKIFEDEVHVYFPASRSEIPFWLNRESVPEVEFDLFTSFAKKMRKPIYAEKGIEHFKQWIISVILESRADLAASPASSQFSVTSNITEVLSSKAVLTMCNELLRNILNDSELRFAWLGRKSPDKVAIARGNTLALPNLDALSGGEAILLGVFGTLIRYADQSRKGQALNLSDIEGICVIDEVDVHIHVDLQHKILPVLIKKFPKVQFIISSHSPLFVIGMEKEFGSNGFLVVEMPSGQAVSAESYSEFGRAMEALAATKAFDARVAAEVSQRGIPIVYVEGETDAPYIQRAVEVLGRPDLLKRCDVEWIGSKDDGGQGFHTGKGALSRSLSFLRANPDLAKRPVLLLYDNDTNVPEADYTMVSVRVMPTNKNNEKIKAGIENLLSPETITEDDYQETKKTKENGEMHIRKVVRKMDLCKRMCEEGTDKNFQAFSVLLDRIEDYLDKQIQKNSKN